MGRVSATSADEPTGPGISSTGTIAAGIGSAGAGAAEPLEASDEVLVSVDIEASGPSPGTGSLLAVGACLVDAPTVGFYRELRPIPGLPWDPAAADIHGLDRGQLELRGAPPRAAMEDLDGWLQDVCGTRRPVFVGFNAPFDWMFVADYCWRYLGRNPFGYAALDLKALYMGRDGVHRWASTTKAEVAARYPVAEAHTHHALEDARMQAALARRLLRDPR
jgi:ribonuclease T